MQREEIAAIFDRQAASYDQQWSRLAPINSALHLLASAVLGELPPNAHVLCVGAGTGSEILYFARKFPGWRFTAVEPSAAMLAVLRRKAEEHGIHSRCSFHSGYLDTFPSVELFDAATAFLVSQFILDRKARSEFFQSIARRLHPHGILVSSDLAGDLSTTPCQNLLQVWFQLMRSNGIPTESEQKMREAYGRDVAVIPPQSISEIISLGSFESPVLFFQAGLIHAWHAKRAATTAEQDTAAGGTSRRC